MERWEESTCLSMFYNSQDYGGRIVLSGQSRGLIEIGVI